MKKNIIIITLILVSILILTGCSTTEKNPQNTNTEIQSENPSENTQDCGISKSLLAQDISKVNLEDDSTLKCLGMNLLNNCKISKAILETNEAGQIIFEIKGLQNSNCIIKYQYGDASQITSVLHQNYANTYLECPLNINELKNNDSSDKPAAFAMGVWAYLGMETMDSQTNCSGTLKEKINP